MTEAIAPWQRQAFAGVLLVLFLSSLNLSVVGTVLPKVVSELGGMHLYAWVFMAYSLTTTLSIPIFGRLSDLYTRRRILLIGIAIFALGSTLLGLVQNMAQLILLRAVQGVGGGALMGLSFAALADIFAPRERGRYQGYTGAVYGVSSLIGPLLGGLIADHFGWRWVFPVNLPAALLAAWMIWKYLPASPRDANGYVDYLGATLLSLGLLPLLIGLSLVGQATASHTLAWGLVAGGIALLAAFAAWQCRSPGPIISPALFRQPVFTVSTFAILLSTAGLYAGILYLPLYMQAVKGLNASLSGLALSPFMLGMVLTSALSGRQISRKGRYKGMVLGGLVVMTLALAGISLLRADTPVWMALALAVLLGCGLGPVNPVFNLIVQLAVPRTQVGAATGALRFFNQIGGTLGACFFGLVMSQHLGSFRPEMLPPAAQQLPGARFAESLNPALLTNAPLLNELRGLLSNGRQLEAFQLALGTLRGLLAASLGEIFLLAAGFALLALLVSLRLPGGLLQERSV
ncbi:MAG: MDR family MFS transporter [Candidatus Sericytochromatia bacterium]